MIDIYEDTKINEEHIVALRKKINSTEIDIFRIKLDKTRFEVDFETLQLMALNEMRDVLDLENFINHSSLSILNKNFNFCSILNSSFQTLSSITNRKEYLEKIDQYNSKIQNASINEKVTIEYEKKKYIKDIKKSIVQNIKDRITAITLDEAYIKAEHDKNIVAYSNRKLGFNNSIFQFDNDFVINYKTNFGYGFSSYFTLNLTYKGLDILPYSIWVKYRYANKTDILRYTRVYPLENKYWEDAIRFSMEIYNTSIRNPEQFIENIVIHECSEMISCLGYLLNCDEYKIQENIFTKNKSLKIEGLELIDYKSEKISGALEFIDKISELSCYSTKIDIYIKNIIEYNTKVQIIIINELKKLNTKISELNQTISEVEITAKELTNENDRYNDIKESIRVNILNSIQSINFQDLTIECNKMFETNHPEYKSFINNYCKITTELNNLKHELYTKSNFKNSLSRHLDTIRDFAKKNNSYNLLVLTA